MVYEDGSTYVGETHENEKSGSGTMKWPNGDQYLGDFA